jgi:hypothetical protein
MKFNTSLVSFIHHRIIKSLFYSFKVFIFVHNIGNNFFTLAPISKAYMHEDITMMFVLYICMAKWARHNGLAQAQLNNA